MSVKLGSLGRNAFESPARTPGPLGYNDAAQPFAPDLLCDTPGSLGWNDLAAHIGFGWRTSGESRKRKKSDPVEQAYLQCRTLGWIPFFQRAAESADFATELLLAIGYRESRLNPKYLKLPGDNGNGYGLMQIDRRSYPDWVAAGNWKDPQECIDKGAEVLASKREGIRSSVGEIVEVKTLAGRSYHFKGKPVSESDLLRITVAAYNCGMWAYYHFSHGHDVDQGTTGQDYSRDVLQKASRFKQLLASTAPLPDEGLDVTRYA